VVIVVIFIINYFVLIQCTDFVIVLKCLYLSTNSITLYPFAFRSFQLVIFPSDLAKMWQLLVHMENWRHNLYTMQPFEDTKIGKVLR